MQKDVGKFGISDKRGRARTSENPFMSDAGLKEPALCTSCHALYRNKRWYLDPEAAGKAENSPDTNLVTCPACQKAAQSYPEGIVTLRGGYLWDHEEEIRNILKNEETKAMAKNPLERIMTMERQGDDLIIETTEKKLAEHLGRAMNKAHQGALNVSWDADHQCCRVTWERMN